MTREDAWFETRSAEWDTFKRAQRAADMQRDYILRHGDTIANEEDVYRGWGAYKLDDEGIKHATAAANFLKNKFDIKRIVSGTLPRQKQTAKIVAKVLGVDLTYDDGFKTLNVGDFTGKKRNDNADKLQKYLDAPDTQIPGGESIVEFTKRSNTAFKKAQAFGGDSLVVTSRSNIFALMDAPTDKKVALASPGGIYELTSTNTLKQIFGKDNTDTLAGS